MEVLNILLMIGIMLFFLISVTIIMCIWAIGIYQIVQLILWVVVEFTHWIENRVKNCFQKIKRIHSIKKHGKGSKILYVPWFQRYNNKCRSIG